MKISTIRTIDYWVGIPLCFFLSLINYLNKLNPFKRRLTKNPKKFLFIELSEMGSSILAYPAMKHLKDQYPEAELFFLIFKKNRASVDILEIIKPENVLIINEHSLLSFIIDVFKFFIYIRKQKIDVAFDLELFSRATAILTYLSGAPLRIGFYKYHMEGLYRGNFYTHKIQYNFQQHISKSFLSFVKVLSLPHKDLPILNEKILEQEITPAVYRSSVNATKQIWQKLEALNPEINKDNKLIILNVGGGILPIRAWPLDNYIALGQKLLEDKNNYLIITGSQSDRLVCEKLVQVLNNRRCLDLVGKTSFVELVDLYNISDVLITNDGGPAHFASLTSIKIFVFFGPESPILYSPLGKNVNILYSNFLCSPCLSAFNHRHTSCQDNKCLQAISVEEVYKKVKKSLYEDS